MAMSRPEPDEGNDDMAQRTGMWRSRWAAVGAAMAVAVGFGGLVTGSVAAPSSGPGSAGSFKPIAPVRILDTRPAPEKVRDRAATEQRHRDKAWALSDRWRFHERGMERWRQHVDDVERLCRDNRHHRVTERNHPDATR